MGYDGISSEALSNLMVHVTRSSEVREAAKKILGKGRYDGLASGDLPFFIDFLRSDDPNKSVEQMVEERLSRGLTLRPKNGTTSAVGDIRVPFKTVDGVVQPAVDMTQYRDAIGTLDEFVNKNILPSNIKPETISVRIAATQADFEAKYNAISATERDLSTAQGVNFTLRPDGSEVKRSTDLGGDLSNKRTVILLNHEVNAANKGEFKGEDSIAETLLHEYGHTVHRSMGLSWGDPIAGESNPKTAKYSDVRAQRISDYGDNNDQEHFAETFAKYLHTGEATPEFLSFLENEVGVEKFDASKVIPSIFLGSDVKTKFLEAMNGGALEGYTVRLTNFNNPLSNMTPAQIRAQVLSARSSGQALSAALSFEGKIYDSQGREVGSFFRTINVEPDGKIRVYHNRYVMDDSAQGGGVGTNFINTSFATYKKLGIDKVEVTAGLSNGPYMWGLMGFDFIDENARIRKLSRVKEYFDVLSAYNKNGSEYDALGDDTTQIAQKMAVDMAKDGTLISGGQARIDEMLRTARRNGWTIDNDFVNELRYLLSLPQSQATAERIALLGKKNKKELNRKYSSVGRVIMMAEGWSGRLYLADWEDPREKAKKNEAK